jgi:exodeoxyribonuclease-1
MAEIGLENKLITVFSHSDRPPHPDPEQALYGGFIQNNDKPTMQEVRLASLQDLTANDYTFYDKRLQEMLWRYKARNFPESLTEQERMQWDEFRYHRITEGMYPDDLTLEHYQEIIEELWMNAEPRDKQILESLAQYGDELLF